MSNGGKQNQENKKNVKKTCGKEGKWGEVSPTLMHSMDGNKKRVKEKKKNKEQK